MTMDGLAALWFFLSVPLATGVMLVVHTIICRARGETAFLNGVFFGFVSGFAALAILQVVLLAAYGVEMESLALGLVVNPLFYCCLSYCYYNFVNLGHASIRIRIYAECLEHGGLVAQQDLAERYNVEKIQAARIRRLLEAGDIVPHGDGYRLGRVRLVPIAATVFFLKRFVLGKHSEFEL
jgi:hypothetical protein